jgi:cytosine permease
LTTVLMARFSFGNVGSRWVDFIMGATQIGWYAFTTAVIVEGLMELLNIPQNGFVYGLLVFVFNYAFCVPQLISATGQLTG